MEKLAPGLWHGYCFTYNKGLGARRVYVDGAEVLEDIMDVDAEKDIPDNFISGIEFMLKTEYPDWTMMTDINIWNVSLTLPEIGDWTNCRERNWGDDLIIDWKTANWKTEGINNEVVNKSSVCYHREREAKIYP